MLASSSVISGLVICLVDIICFTCFFFFYIIWLADYMDLYMYHDICISVSELKK